MRAVIDVGSNSILLVVADKSSNSWQIVHEASIVTGLGRGTKSSGHLNPDGALRTLEALREFFLTANTLGATKITAAGTMALRMASDASTFLESCEAQGTPISIISGEQEAELGFLSVVRDPALQVEGDIAVIDPGGHSTEIVIGNPNEIIFRESFPIGALGLRETELKSDPCPPPERLRSSLLADEVFGVLPTGFDIVQVFTIGATGVNLVSLREKLDKFDPARVHGSVLEYEEVARAFGWLGDLTDDQRRKLPGLEPGREHTIHAGTLILERALFRLSKESCTVSVRGWRHALLESPLS